MQEDRDLVCPSVVGSFVIGINVLGSSGKNGLKDEESEPLPTGFKAVYKIFENFQIKSISVCRSQVGCPRRRNLVTTSGTMLDDILFSASRSA